MLMFQDIRYALRTMWKTPYLLSTAILALALGIGVNTANFTVVRYNCPAPSPALPDSGRIVALMRTYPSGHGPVTSVPKFFAWKTDNCDVLEGTWLPTIYGPWRKPQRGAVNRNR